MKCLSSLACLISVLTLSACSTMRAPSLNLLTERSDYDGSRQIEEALKEVGDPVSIPKRTGPTLADIWIHPHEMATGDYFRGGWVRTIVSDSRWKTDDASLIRVQDGPEESAPNQVKKPKHNR